VEVADAQSVKRCPACGARTATVHDTRSRRVRDLPSLGRPTTLMVVVRRYQCRECDRRVTPDHPELAGKISRRLALALVSASASSRSGNWPAVTASVGISSWESSGPGLTPSVPSGEPNAAGSC
jgi:transposase